MPGVTKDTASTDQVVAYIHVNQSAIRALNNAILVAAEMMPLVTVDQRVRLEAEKTSMIAERKDLSDEIFAFTSEGATIQSPDAPTVDAVNKIAAQLDIMTANSVAAEALVTTASDLIGALQAAGIPSPANVGKPAPNAPAANLATAHRALFNALARPFPKAMVVKKGGAAPRRGRRG